MEKKLLLRRHHAVMAGRWLDWLNQFDISILNSSKQNHIINISAQCQIDGNIGIILITDFSPLSLREQVKKSI